MTPAEREELILGLEPLVRIIAKKRVSRLPSFARVEDLISAGWIGAIDAVDRFDPARNVKLVDYAKWRIHGAIGDYLRSIDPLGRDYRTRVRRGDEEAPIVFSIDREVVDNTHHQDNVIDAHEGIADVRASSEQARHEARLVLQSIYRRARLRPRNARILKLWLEGGRMKAIGEAYGLNESRVSQLCSRAISKLRAAA